MKRERRKSRGRRGRQEGKRLSQRGGHMEVARGLQGTDVAVTTFRGASH